MNLRLSSAAVVAALLLFCTACTDGSWLDQTRVSFHTEGIDTVLASEPRANNEVLDMASRGHEVLAVLEINTSAFDGHRAAYSPDNGASWQPVLFDGRAEPGMALVNTPSVREGQWLLLGYRNGQLFAFTSANGTDFTLRPRPVVDTTTGIHLNAVVGTDQGWLVATSAESGAAVTLYQSSDGSAWTGLDGTAAGLPPADSTFHPLSMAAGPHALLLVGQEVPSNRPPYARAFSSSDGGSSWQDATPDTSGVGLLGNSLRTAAWSGTEFRVSGHAWPGAQRPKDFPLGMSGSWTPGGAWHLAADPSWSSQDQEFPRRSDVAYGSAGAIATQMIGELSVDIPKVLLQGPGQPWSELELPGPADDGLRLYSDVTAVADGFLVAGSDSHHGNDQVRLWHVDAGGAVTERHAALEAAAPLLSAGKEPHISGFSGDSGGGKTLAFGAVGSQPAFWELEGGKNFGNYTTLVSDENQTLDTMAAASHGLMMLGSSRTANSQLPVIWTRPDGGAWSVYTGNIFGAGIENGDSPVKAVLPSSHGFLAAGWFQADGTDHAGIAVSEDGATWSHLQGSELRGAPSAGRYIGALAETAAGTVLAGGSIHEGELSTAAVWTSADARTWTPVILPQAEGYPDAHVMSLTAGPSRTVAVVQHSSTGKPVRYSTYSSGDNGLTWEHGTDLDAPSPEQDVAFPRLAVNGEGFVLLATHGAPRQHSPVLMLSGDGRHFTARRVEHNALEQEDLSVSAIGIAGERLMIAGTTGPADERESFAISIDVPEP